MTELETELLETLLMVIDRTMTEKVTKKPVLNPDLIKLPNGKCPLRLLERLGLVKRWDVIPSYYVFTDKALELGGGYI